MDIFSIFDSRKVCWLCVLIKAILMSRQNIPFSIKKKKKKKRKSS